MMLLNNMDF